MDIWKMTFLIRRHYCNSASAPWRFANYGRGSVEATDSTEPRASASGQIAYANFYNLVLAFVRRVSLGLGFDLFDQDRCNSIVLHCSDSEAAASEIHRVGDFGDVSE